MLAEGRRSACFLRKRRLLLSSSLILPPSARALWAISFIDLLMAFCIFSFISEAAALVKVTISILSMGHLSSIIILFIRSTRTAVLPEPAAAATRMFLFLSSMAFFCSGVQFITTPPVSSNLLLYLLLTDQ